MKILVEADVARLERVARSFADWFDGAATDGVEPMVAARRRLLGPTTVWRTLRALANQAGLGQRIADIGLRSSMGHRGSPRRAFTSQRIDASATGAVIASALTAWQLRGDAPARLEVGPRCALEPARAALAPLLESGELVLEEVGADARRTRAVVAPYFYSPDDLRRVAQVIALEHRVPSPHSEGGLELYVARGWDQRRVFAERLGAAVAELAAQPLEAIALDVDDSAELFEKVRHLPDGADAIAAFVYPMLRERADVDASLIALLREFDLAVINHTPAIAWALGQAPAPQTLLVQVDQRMRGITSPPAMARRARFEEARSVPRALGTLARAWVG